MAGRYVFLASHAYSGSTFLSYLMGAHPQIATVSDVSGQRREHVMDTFKCSCGRLMAACPFWMTLLVELRRTGLEFSLANFELGFDRRSTPWLGALRVRSLGSGALEHLRDRAFRLIPGDERHMVELGKRNAAFARTVLRTRRASIFVDASKERLRARYLQRYVDPDLRVIHLIRDARGVVDSTIRRGKRPISPTEAARRWARTNDAIARSMSGIPPTRRHVVRYEDVCDNPGKAMREIFAFCGVDPQVDVEHLLGGEQHLLGNRMRLDGVQEIRLDERWQSTLTSAELSAIAASAGPLQASLYQPAQSGGGTP
jgi:hypothetical protein